MLLNAHSTAVMAKLGRVVGNTMTTVRAGNLKLIGRATYLVKMHVDDILKRSQVSTEFQEISYQDANAVLYDAIAFNNQDTKETKQVSEVPMSIIKILEGIRNNFSTSWEKVDEINQTVGLEKYLQDFKTY